jgi:hypothetical protein
MVEAVAYHHRPNDSLQSSFSPVAAVHSASVYHEQGSSSWLRDGSPLDVEFLFRIGCTEKESRWRETLGLNTAADAPERIPPHA